MEYEKTTIKRLSKESKTRRNMTLTAIVFKENYLLEIDTSIGILKDPKSESFLPYISSGINSNSFILANVTKKPVTLKGNYLMINKGRIGIFNVYSFSSPKKEEMIIG